MIGLANHPTIALRRTETGSMALWAILNDSSDTLVPWISALSSESQISWC
jgi:hypothetical protein